MNTNLRAASLAAAVRAEVRLSRRRLVLARHPPDGAPSARFRRERQRFLKTACRLQWFNSIR